MENSNIKNISSKIKELLSANKDEDTNLNETRIQEYNKEGLYEVYLFKDIPIKEIKPKPINKENIFGVDGSNATIFKTTEICVMLVRIVGATLERAKYFSEFISFTYFDKGKGTYILKHYHLRGIDLFENYEEEYNPFSLEYTFKGKRANPYDISSILRKFGEWKMIKYINEKERNVIILKDGGLHSTISKEVTLIKETIRSLNKSNYLAGIVKENLLLTNNGRNLVYDAEKYVNDKSSIGRWVFGPIAKGMEEIHPAFLYIVKFHPEGRAFRMDVPNNRQEIEFIDSIAKISNDPLVLGYPYVLIKADRESNIKPDEIHNLKIRLTQNLPREIEIFEDIHNYMWKI